MKLWRLSDWAQLGSTYTISGLQAGQWVNLGLRLNGNSLSVEIDGVTRITATDSTFSTGEVGLWSYQPTSANQHIFDDFLVQNLGQGYVPGWHVRASLEKVFHRGNELRKAQLLQAPPSGQVWTSYYFAGSARVAMRVQVNGSTDQVYYLLADHLGSTAITVDTNNNKVAEIRYAPWGTTRYIWGTTPTDYRFTGQREENGIGLYFYKARFYDAYLNRWTQPDSIIPEPGNVLDWDRYSYARNNPVRYSDPSGHVVDDGCRNESCNYGTEERRADIFRQHNWRKGNVEAEVISDLEGLAQLSDYASDLSGNCIECFVEDLGAVMTGMSNGSSAKYELMHRINPKKYPYDTYFLNASKLGQSGYSEVFQDPNPELTGGNQGRHFWFYVQVGYESGVLTGAMTNVTHETIIPLTRAGKSLQDLSLGYEGIALGYKLRQGSIATKDIGNYMLENLSPGSASASFWERYWPSPIKSFYQYLSP